MSKSKKYGKLKEEIKLEESIISREIVGSILKYGVSQYQISKIIFLLSLELEDRDVLENITNAIKPLLEGKIENNSSIIVTE
jgi:hypothetical protein